MSDTELKNCPVCKFSASVIDDEKHFMIECDGGNNCVQVGCLAKDKDKTIDMWQNGVRPSQWISVDERLPEDNTDIFIRFTHKNGDDIRYMGAKYCKSIAKWYLIQNDISGVDYNVTHWMPIPPIEENK